MREFRYPVRVYYEDTDAGGVVYYANYLKFMERARTEWLRSLGVEQDALRRETGAAFVVRRVAVDYHRPARLDDALWVTAAITGERRASLEFEQAVCRGPEAAPEVLCRGRVTIACVDLESLRPRPFPQSFKEVWQGVG